jgi:hypothetical protein
MTNTPAERMWTLSADQRSVCMQIPPLRLAGLREPLNVHLDFDTAMVDDILHRLTVIWSRMLPALTRN